FLRQQQREPQVPQIELRLVQIEQSLRECRIIVQKSRDRGLALSISPQQDAGLRIVHPRDHKLRRPPRRLRVARLVQHCAAQRECGDHEPVPRGEDLIVEMRADTAGARLEQNALRRLDSGADFFYYPLELLRRLLDRRGLIQNVAIRELLMWIVRNVATL